MNLRILNFDILGSTNTEALDRARSGEEEGLCIIARQQTAGRGRQGRTWVSEKDAGLYLSLLLRPNLEPRFLPLVTLMAGVAVHDTLQSLGIGPDIKWVNDVHVGGKKISGILAETTETRDGTAVVLGIGINIRATSIPPEIASTATSIEIVTGNAVDRSQLISALLEHISRFYELLCSPRGGPAIIDEWSRRSTYFSGKHVRVETTGSVIEGVTDGLEPNGALRVRRADGAIEVIVAGDVTSLRATQRSD
ncbi:MAG TPA: biotin--[acetyl-CoA-carboxylase] ligase [Pyrinomonadaceae bacterium]|nr:biotin--[acetyl-CoA-carboxylase] ligase [Pyrinomonadaceae bacterium]